MKHHCIPGSVLGRIIAREYQARRTSIGYGLDPSATSGVQDHFSRHSLAKFVFSYLVEVGKRNVMGGDHAPNDICSKVKIKALNDQVN